MVYFINKLCFLFLYKDFYMKNEVLNCFYKLKGTTYEFMKNKFICMIKDLVISRNTYDILCTGFNYYDAEQEKDVKIGCDDEKFIEYQTFYDALKLGVITFPCTIRPSLLDFLSIKSIDEFEKIYKKILKFRIDNKKRCWAIQFGFEYKDDSYENLELLSESELINWKDPRKNAKYSLDDVTFDMVRAYGYNI